MSLPLSDYPVPTPITGQQPPGRGRALARLSAILAITALTVSAAWLPVMVVIAFALRPPELAGSRLSYQEAAPLQHDAQLRMWIILITTFLVTLTLVTLATIFGRRAQRMAGNAATLARLRRWGGIALIVSLLSLIDAALLLYGPVAYWLTVNMSYIYTISRFMLVFLAAMVAMGAEGSLILNGIAARRAAVREWLSLVVSALALLLWFLSGAVLAQFTVAFYMHLVY